jgi:hypothetical protein
MSEVATKVDKLKAKTAKSQKTEITFSKSAQSKAKSRERFNPF